MKKKGQFDPITIGVGVILLGGILLVGGISSYSALSENRYIGDTDTGKYYDLSKCIVDTNKDTIIKFKNKAEAINSGLPSAECNNK